MGDKILQFKKNILYVVNISTGIAAEFFVESRHKYKGILNKYSWCEVGDSIFWFNKNSAYLYDGEIITDLILTKDKEDTTQRLNTDVWASFVSSDSLCHYNNKTKEIFVIKKTSYSANKEDGSAYVYNTVLDAWTKVRAAFYGGNGKVTTNFVNYGTEGTLSSLYSGGYGLSDNDGGIET